MRPDKLGRKINSQGALPYASPTQLKWFNAHFLRALLDYYYMDHEVSMAVLRTSSTKMKKERKAYPNDWFIPDSGFWEVKQGEDFYVSIGQFRTELHRHAWLDSVASNRLISVKTTVAKPIPHGSIEFSFHDNGPLSDEDREALAKRINPYVKKRAPSKVPQIAVLECRAFGDLRSRNDCFHCAKGNEASPTFLPEWVAWWKALEDMQDPPASSIASEDFEGFALWEAKLLMHYRALVEEAWREKLMAWPRNQGKSWEEVLASIRSQSHE